MRRPCALSFALLFAAVLILPLSSLELGEGVVKLVVNDITGRVAFYRLAEVGRNRYEPLLFDQDSRTTFPTLALDSRYYRLGEAAEFRFSLARIEHGVVIFFKSSSCVVRQRIELVKSEGSSVADSFKMSFDIENTGSQDIRVGFRMLLDTWLGEKDGQHFSTGSQSKVTEETRITKDVAERSITSPGEYATLRVDLAGEGITPPDEIVLANWKRLSDSNWSFEASGLRGFSFAPFSINDSAMALYWLPENLARNAVWKLSFNMVSLPGKALVAKSSSDVTKASSVPLITAQPAATSQGSQATAPPPTVVTGETPASSPVTTVSAAAPAGPVVLPSGPTIVSPTPTPATSSAPAVLPAPVATPAAAASVVPSTAAAILAASTASVAAPAASTPAASAPAPAASAAPVARRTAMEADIAELWDLLGKINAGIANPGSVSDSQLAEWKRRITALQGKYNGK